MAQAQEQPIEYGQKENIQNGPDPGLYPPVRIHDVEVDSNALVNSEYSQSVAYEGSAFCNPSSRVHRYFVLIFMCLLAFGSYYCYDNPSALVKHIEADMKVNDAQYGNLYSWYSYPNVILCFFGGFLLDSVFGIRLGAIIFAGIICLGQVIVAGGALIDNFWVMVFGRFIFGVGGESLAVAQNTYAVLWFKGKELNTVFGVQLSVARLGSMANFNSIPYVYNYVSKQFTGHTALGVTLMLAGALCLFSLICALILAFFDKRAERILNRANESSGETVNITDVLYFPISFWLLCFVCVLYYVSIFPFISYAGAYLQDKYNMTESEADAITSIPYTVSAIVSPLCGLLCDVTGLNLIWTIVATVLSAGCHLTFSYAPIDLIHPGIIMGVLGFGFSLLACAFWPMVALVIPEHQLGTAYGVMQAIQNLGLAVVGQTAGMIKQAYGDSWLELYFLFWMSLAIIMSIGLQVQNIVSKGQLNPPLYKKNLCGRSDDDEQREALINTD